MADTIIVETPVATVLEVSGLQGPQGPTGPQGPAGDVSGSIAWSNVTGKPSTFTPSAHTHTSADVTDFAAAVVAAAPPTTNASLLTSGTLPDARLSAAVTTSLGKADTASQPGHTHAASAISDSTTTGRSVLTATDAAAARTAIGAQASGSYAAASHSHAIADVTGLQTALDGKQASGSYAAASHTHAASDIASGTLDNARVNWAAPSALGSTTAAAATVTDLKADTLIMPKSGQPTILANVSSGNLSATGQIYAATFATASGGKVEIASGGSLQLNSGAAIIDPVDSTKKAALDLSGITAGQTRTLIVPNATGTLALTSDITKTAVGLGNVTNNAQVTSVSGTAPIVSSGGTTPTISVTTGTTAGTVAAGDHTHSQLHDRSHAITSTSDHTATANRVFYSNNSGQVTELALGAANTVLTSNGTTSAPSFAALPSGGSKTYAAFTAEHNQPPSTAFATLDTRNSIAVLDFDASSDENAVFVGIMPEAASLGSGLIVRLHWMATSATSGNVRWGVQFERSNTDLDADSFDTAVEATAATNGTSGIITTTAITVTTIDGITAGDVFRLKVFRNADDATNDTMTGDAELVAVEVRSAA